MFLPGSFSVALLMMLLGMVFWGSWANAYKLAPGWRFELFYFDYAVSIFLTCTLASLTMGTLFGSPDFIENLMHADAAAWAYALAAGVLLNAGNILLMAGIVLAGMSVAFPVSLGLSLVVSTLFSYIIMPRGDPTLLFLGVGLVFLAVILNSLAYRTANQSGPAGSRRGLRFCLLSGILFSAFGPLVAKAYSTGRPLSPYGVAVLFTAGALLSTFPLMRFFMRRPVAGAPLTGADYWRGSAREHWAGLFGGFIWGMGTVLTFVAAGLVGMALAGAIGQANPLVAALWGVLVWREFHGAPKRSQILLMTMCLFYLAGLA